MGLITHKTYTMKKFNINIEERIYRLLTGWIFGVAVYYGVIANDIVKGIYYLIFTIVMILLLDKTDN